MFYHICLAWSINNYTVLTAIVKTISLSHNVHCGSDILYSNVNHSHMLKNTKILGIAIEMLLSDDLGGYHSVTQLFFYNKKDLIAIASNH